MEKSVSANVMRPKEAVFYHSVMPKNRMEYTGSTCHFICRSDKKVRKNRYKFFCTSGVIIQDESGKRYPLKAEEAEGITNNIDQNRKKLFTDRINSYFLYLIIIFLISILTI